MTLPIRQLPTEDFTFNDGAVIPIRGLSRAESIQLRELGEDVTAVEVHCIKAATGATEEEAKAWHASAPNDDIEQLINAIARLSGLDNDVGKDDAGALPSAKLIELISYLQRISDELLQKSENSAAQK